MKNTSLNALPDYVQSVVSAATSYLVDISESNVFPGYMSCLTFGPNIVQVAKSQLYVNRAELYCNLYNIW